MSHTSQISLQAVPGARGISIQAVKEPYISDQPVCEVTGQGGRAGLVLGEGSDR